MASRPPRPPRVRSGLGHRDILKRRALELIRKIHDKDKFAIFHEPVPLDEVPGYSDIIATPMDLSTVRNNATAGVYHSPNELRADLDLIWSNCVKFNAADTIYHKEAVRLRALAGKLFEEFLRNLERDGLPYGPRASNAVNKTPGAQLRAVTADTTANAVPLQTVGQRLRNISLARRKAQRESSANAEPTELERAASEAADALIPPPDKHQIYDGPYQRVRRFPNAHHASLFPYVRGGCLEKRLQPFPPAWQALGRFRPYSQLQQPNLTPQQHDMEMSFAQQYQDYIIRSAPIARRILATVLDPLAVVEHDAAQMRNAQQKKFPDVCDTTSKGIGTTAPKKRPRHGELQRTSNNFDNASGSTRPAVSSQPLPPSPDELRNLRDALQAHNIDDSFLSAILNSSQPNLSSSGKADGESLKPAEPASVDCSPERMDVDTGATEDNESGEDTASNLNQTPEKTSIDSAVDDHSPNRMDVCVGAPGEDSSASALVKASTKLSPIAQPENDGGDEKDGNEMKNEPGSCPKDPKDEDENGSEESMDTEEERDGELDDLLRANHETMKNVQRIRALKEMAIGQAHEDLEQEENRYAVILQKGIARATAALPPQLLISKEKAGALLVDAAKETVKRHRKEEEEKVKSKKQKMETSADETPTTAAENGDPKLVVETNTTADASSEAKKVITNTVAQNGVVEPNGVSHGGVVKSGGKLKAAVGKSVGVNDAGKVGRAKVMEKA